MKMQTVFASHYTGEVYFVQSLLNSSGIQTTILDENISTLAPHLIIATGGPKIAVSEKDAPEAFEIVNDYLSQKDSNPEHNEQNSDEK